MSNTDFQQRLQRIGARSEPQDYGRGTEAGPRSEKPDLRLIGLGGFLLVSGLQSVKYANQNYEALRDGSMPGMVFALGVGGLVLLLVGVMIFFRAFAKGRTVKMATEMPETSIAARVICSLLGFAFGVIACMYLFLAAGARFIETEKAQLFSEGGIVIALGLLLFSLLLGLIGLFLRGYGLGRIPIYYFLGGAITWAVVRIMNINVLEWTQFVAMLQG